MRGLIVPCLECGKERQVRTIRGEPRNLRCLDCSRSMPHTPETKAIIKAGKLGDKNPNWKGDNITRGTGNWRAQSLHPGPKPCVRCGAKGERHHVDGNPVNNAPENIAWLCRHHHMEVDGRLRSSLFAMWAIRNPSKPCPY